MADCTVSEHAVGLELDSSSLVVRYEASWIRPHAQMNLNLRVPYLEDLALGHKPFLDSAASRLILIYFIYLRP